MLQAEACNFTKINNNPKVFFTFLKLYKWYQIAQCVTYAPFDVYNVSSAFTETAPSLLLKMASPHTFCNCCFISSNSNLAAVRAQYLRLSFLLVEKKSLRSNRSIVSCFSTSWYCFSNSPKKTESESMLVLQYSTKSLETQ